jgi:hypothetical protein
MMRVNRGDLTWDAWVMHHGDATGDAAHGLPLHRLGESAAGFDLSFMVKVDGQQRGPIYHHVHRSAWESDGPIGAEEGGYFEYRNVGADAFERCEEDISHANSNWNWSICRESGRGCAGYSRGGCLLVHGDGGTNTEVAGELWGLNSYRRERNFDAIEVWARE